MRGMDRNTGKAIEGREHLLQSLGDIFTTPIRTRVMRREYGLDDSLIDRPASINSLGAWTYSVANALDIALETRYQLTQVKLYRVDSLGRAHLAIIGTDTEGGGKFEMDGIIF